MHYLSVPNQLLFFRSESKFMVYVNTIISIYYHYYYTASQISKATPHSILHLILLKTTETDELLPTRYCCHAESLT